MKPINRRHLLASLGVLGGSSIFSGCGQNLSGMDVGRARSEDGPTELPSPTSAPWSYQPIEPEAVGQTAYRIYPEGGCMYAVVGSVIGELADKVGDPFRSFPVEMMRYGDGGVGAWGSLCGIVNGGSALIGLFHREKSKETREELITDLCAWYETTSLPKFVPTEPGWFDEAEPSVAGSVLCHISTAEWCKATGYEAFCVEKKERCRRMAADGAMKIVDILNRKARDESCDFARLSPETKSCVDCHGPRDIQDAMGKMSCATCHQFDRRHP